VTRPDLSVRRSESALLSGKYPHVLVEKEAGCAAAGVGALGLLFLFYMDCLALAIDRYMLL
jgi:hypothetical protein